ncbi:MAG: hypothetical protein RL735_2262 [Pseudomonadota bacterium]
MHSKWIAASLTSVLIALSGASTTAQADIKESVVQIPVRVQGSDGTPHQQSITLTIFRDERRKQAPFLILNHGRAGDPQERKNFGRSVFREQSRYFVDKGFVVILPTRIGYGVTEGPDLETSGPCSNKDYPASLVPAVAQVEAAIRYAKAQDYVDPARGAVVGQSVGGFTTIGTAAKNIAGVKIAINFAGGAGGDPKNRRSNPCQADRIADTYGELGAKARIPTLWLYSVNDAYWGPDHPKQWVAAFTARGGRAEFVALPAHGDDGHSSFRRDPEAWQPKVDAFLKKNGF